MTDMPQNPADMQDIAVFDIGGTWFRSAVYSFSSGLTLATKTAAYNYKNTKYDRIADLQLKLVDYLIRQVHLFEKSRGVSIRAASISMGAALNGYTGEILNSGPLWGPACQRFDLLPCLKERAPKINWIVVNDVSAALLRYTKKNEYAGYKRINLITVSSGIACRTYARKGQYIPLNEIGVQGEIGHIPINFSIFGHQLSELCDCGGCNHLNAFSSGRGIENILNRIIDLPIGIHKHSNLISALDSNRKNGTSLNASYIEAINVKDDLALQILDAVTNPIARAIVNMLTIDPEIEKIIITGGVVHSAEESYMQSLLEPISKFTQPC